MACFHMGDVAIDLDGYSTRMVVLARPGEAQGASLVIARDAVDDDVTAQDYAQAHLEVMAESLDGFQGVSTSEIEIAGERVPLVEVRAKGQGGAMYTTVVAYQVRKGEAFTLSASHVAGAAFESVRPAMLKAFKTFRSVGEP